MHYKVLYKNTLVLLDTLEHHWIVVWKFLNEHSMGLSEHIMFSEHTSCLVITPLL